MSFTLDIYTRHFGLDQRPFTLVPNPEFIYWSPTHRRAAAVLEYGIVTRSPITMITGEIGSGKTTLLRHLLRGSDEHVTIGLISNARTGGGETLLNWVLSALGQEIAPGASHMALYRQFERFLLEEYAEGRRVVLIFDEAQNLGRDALEDIRMLTNINSDEDELLQLVLVGQPELRDIVSRPDMVQLAQRIAASFYLPALPEGDVGGYVAHRLEVAGATRPIFEEDAFPLILEVTGGVPRLINQLCDFALLYAFEAGAETVGRAVIQQVLDDGVFFPGGRVATLRLVHGAEPAPPPAVPQAVPQPGAQAGAQTGGQPGGETAADHKMQTGAQSGVQTGVQAGPKAVSTSRAPEPPRAAGSGEAE